MSKAMVADQFFDHVAPNGSDPVARIRSAGYIPKIGAWTVGENLAWGTGSLATPKSIVSAWMKSSGHRENILRPEYKEIGFGVVTGNPRSRSGSGATFTTTFGGITGGQGPRAPLARPCAAPDRQEAASGPALRPRPRTGRSRTRAPRRARSSRPASAASPAGRRSGPGRP